MAIRTVEDLNLYTRIGPGTPMGELFRRYWLPVLLAEEVRLPDGPPVRVRLLGEDLLAFRDSNGDLGLLSEYCPHRRASLYFGRNEQCGIRCTYHGWKFDVNGTCVDIPNEPDGSGLQAKVRQPAYRIHEAGGVVWAYLGPSDSVPPFPHFEWCGLPPENRVAYRWEQQTNWAQAMEGEIDSSHISFLHAELASGSERKSPNDLGSDVAYSAPRLSLEETEYGFVYGARRRREGNPATYNWRLTQWMMPMYSLVPTMGGTPACRGRAWVPIDDYRTMTFFYFGRPDRPLDDSDWEEFNSGRSFPTRLIPGTFTPLANRDNDYLLDRDRQSNENYTGIYGINEQDRAVQESMEGGAIANRLNEQLTKSDLPIVVARRRLMNAARELASSGTDPKSALSPESWCVRSLNVDDDAEDLPTILERYASNLRAPCASAALGGRVESRS